MAPGSISVWSTVHVLERDSPINSRICAAEPVNLKSVAAVYQEKAALAGKTVSAKGKVVLNRDFGSGYSYPLLIEEAIITPVK